MKKIVLLVVSLWAALMGVEWFFCAFLLELHPPSNEVQFESWIASKWPQPVSLRKPEGVFRILGLSDSYGTTGKDKNYHYVLERNLIAQGLSVDLVNLSHGAYELEDKLQILTQYGSRYRPDLVLHGFFVGNDFEDAGRLGYFRGAWLHRYPRLSAYFYYGQPVVVGYVKSRWQMWKNFRELQQEKSQGKSTGPFSEKRFLSLQKEIMDRLYLDTAVRRHRRHWAEKRMDEIQKTAEEMGARYVVVIHPAQFQVERPLREELERRGAVHVRENQIGEPQKFLVEYCHRRGVPVLDLLPIFCAQGAEGGLYLLHNTHYNEQGNALAAQQIELFLKTHDLIPYNTKRHEESTQNPPKPLSAL